MKWKFLLTSCFFGFFCVHLAYARWPGVDPQAEANPSMSPYAFCGGSPVSFVDPDGKDYYRSTGGAVVWQDENRLRLEIDGELYHNIGTSYSMQTIDGDYVNYYQNVPISISAHGMNAEGLVLGNPELSGALLRKGSPLAAGAQQRLMGDMIHQAQREFLIQATDLTGTALETVGTGIAITGYVISATGVGAGIGGAMSVVGSNIGYIGTGLRTYADLNRGNYRQVAVNVASYGFNKNMSRFIKYGTGGVEQLEAGVSLFFTPASIMIGNIQYK